MSLAATADEGRLAARARASRAENWRGRRGAVWGRRGGMRVD